MASFDCSLSLNRSVSHEQISNLQEQINRLREEIRLIFPEPDPPPPPPFDRLRVFVLKLQQQFFLYFQWIRRHIGLGFAFLLGLGLGFYLHINLPIIQGHLSRNWCQNFALDDNLSCGEEILFSEKVGSTLLENKRKGVEAFQRHKYDDAYSFFKQARSEDRIDPETLIYLENAEMLRQQRKTYTIAVVVPLNQNTTDIAEAISCRAFK